MVYQTPKDKAKIWQQEMYFMEDFLINHLKNIYGLNPDIPHLALQFPRLPPGLFNPIFKMFENPIKEKIAAENAIINKKLQGFQSAYQKYASGLMTMNPSGIIPPGHPLFSLHNSVSVLKTENDKLFKENIELRKKLDKKETRHHNP